MSEMKVYDGGLAIDDRGTVGFVNAFDFVGVKRAYLVENFDTRVIRAFHGHLREGKYVQVVYGTIILNTVMLDEIKAPARTAHVNRYVLSHRKPCIVWIPPGYANGFRALEAGSRVMFFSTATLEESKGDDYRFPADYWGSDVWNVENR